LFLLQQALPHDSLTQLTGPGHVLCGPPTSRRSVSLAIVRLQHVSMPFFCFRNAKAKKAVRAAPPLYLIEGISNSFVISPSQSFTLRHPRTRIVVASPHDYDHAGQKFGQCQSRRHLRQAHQAAVRRPHPQCVVSRGMTSPSL